MQNGRWIRDQEAKNSCFEKFRLISSTFDFSVTVSSSVEIWKFSDFDECSDEHSRERKMIFGLERKRK